MNFILLLGKNAYASIYFALALSLYFEIIENRLTISKNKLI